MIRLTIIYLLLSFSVFSQVGIGTTTPDAILDIESINSGILIPRMTRWQRNNTLTTPDVGELIYQTNNTPGFYYYNGTSWNAISGTGGELEVVTEGGNNGHRLKGKNPLFLGDIGENAVDFSTSTLTGNHGAMGDYSLTTGFCTSARSFCETSIGMYNTIITPNSTSTWNGNDRVFSVGIGVNQWIRTDALEVFKDGTIYADELDLAEITNNKQLVTKEYVDATVAAAAGAGGGGGTFNIGDRHLGGIVFMTWNGGQNGYIVSEDWWRGVWDDTSGAYLNTNCRYDGVGSGPLNTEQLVDAGLFDNTRNSLWGDDGDGDGDAIRGYTTLGDLDGDGDNERIGGWFVPSQDLLIQLAQSGALVNGSIPSGANRLVGGLYWTAREVSNSTAAAVNFLGFGAGFNGAAATIAKNQALFLRLVREF